jgi:Chaperone of endosialidase
VRLGAPNRIDSDSGLRIAGNLGVGTDPSNVSADFGGALGRIRVRQGAAGTAGLWFNEGAKGDRAFVGMTDDNNVGLFGSPVGWGLVMNADTGNVGVGTTSPLRKLQLGGDVNGLSFDPGVTPNAGVIRFGDNTGWKLHFGRSREASDGTPNSGTNGLLMTIQDNGNVGIGTATPSSKLEVRGEVRWGNNNSYLSADQGGSIELGSDNFTAGSGTPFIDFHFNGKVEDFNTRIINDADGQLTLLAPKVVATSRLGIGIAPSDMVLDVASRMRVRMGGSPSAGIWMNQNAAGDRAFVGMADNDHVGFWGPGPGWSMVMNATSGFVGIGTQAPAFTLDVKSNGRIKLGLEGSGGGQLQLANNPNDNKVWLEAFNAAGNGNAAEMLLTGMNGGNLPQITLNANTIVANGNALKPGGGSWGTTSDAALKKNISTLTGALDKLLQLRGVTFEWKEPEKQGNLVGAQIGLVAQEVEPVFPEWIGATRDGAKTLSIRGFEALVIEAFRQIREDIKALSDAAAKPQLPVEAR